MIDALKNPTSMKDYMELKVFQGYGILTIHILSSQSRDPRRGMSYP
jgi:hypothetical protein